MRRRRRSRATVSRHRRCSQPPVISCQPVVPLALRFAHSSVFCPVLLSFAPDQLTELESVVAQLDLYSKRLQFTFQQVYK